MRFLRTETKEGSWCRISWTLRRLSFTVAKTTAKDYWQEVIKQVYYSLRVCCCVSDTAQLASARRSNVQVRLEAVIWVMLTIAEKQRVEQLACQIRATWQLLKEDQLWSVFGSKRLCAACAKYPCGRGHFTLATTTAHCMANYLMILWAFHTRQWPCRQLGYFTICRKMHPKSGWCGRKWGRETSDVINMILIN